MVDNWKEILMGFLEKLFGTYSEREVKRIMPLVNKINGRTIVMFVGR